jgi:hypothetical protein
MEPVKKRLARSTCWSKIGKTRGFRICSRKAGITKEVLDHRLNLCFTTLNNLEEKVESLLTSCAQLKKPCEKSVGP